MLEARPSWSWARPAGKFAERFLYGLGDTCANIRTGLSFHAIENGCSAIGEELANLLPGLVGIGETCGRLRAPNCLRDEIVLDERIDGTRIRLEVAFAQPRVWVIAACADGVLP